MERYLRAFFDAGKKPNRAQHLVVSDSKHLFFYEKDELIKYQKKDLDPRTCGKREMLTRVIAIDEDTGVFYAELWPRSDPIDLVGFLARSWSRKRAHPLRGFPSILYVPRRVLADERMAREVSWSASVGGSVVLPSPSGFGPATVAAREYERQLLSPLLTGSVTAELPLSVACSAAQEISLLACGNSIAYFREHWSMVKGPSVSALGKFDAAYEVNGSWRLKEFERFIVPDGT